METIKREIKLSRGLLVRNGKVLLVQDIRPGQGHYFLPGGNVEPGEPVRSTLAREWEEELGWQIQAGQFLGCLEHSWNYNRKQDHALVEVYEMNFIFEATASPKTLTQEPKSKEPHLNFSWVSLNDLETLNLLPSPLKKLIPEILEKKFTGAWASTLESK